MENPAFRINTAKDYPELESRMAIFHTGKTSQSSEVNSVWREALSTSEVCASQKEAPDSLRI